jgi:hypothetical protein
MRFLFWRRQRRDEELEEEIQAHLEMAKRDRMERGETDDEAQESARREFGNIGLVKEVTREMWGWRWLEQLGQDLHYSVRMLMKKPGFTLTVVITMALGIGADTTLFSVVNVVLLNPFPYPDHLGNLYAQIGRSPDSYAPALLLVTALLAGLGPARRAGRVDPAVTLLSD